MDLKDIKAIIDLMKKNSISEFELEKQDFKIKLKRGSNGGGSAIYEENATSALLAGIPAGQAALPAPATAAVAPGSPNRRALPGGSRRPVEGR